MNMKIGIPKALLYFKYSSLWESFFDSLEIDYVISPDTNKDIINRGTSLAVDESCLSFKTYLGHVDFLCGCCDAVFVPRISNSKAGIVCTRFQAVYDLARNTFRDRDIRLLHYNIDADTTESEMGAFLKLGKTLGKTKPQTLLAYLGAKQAERKAQLEAAAMQQKLLKKEGAKVLVVAHNYNVYDEYIGAPVLRALRDMGAVPVIGCDADPRETVAASYKLSETVPWLSSRELLGAVALLQHSVDGIIMMSTFPCGPDSMVNEVLIRRVKDKPILNLILDGQEGTAGLETRIESFMDIINFKKESANG